MTNRKDPNIDFVNLHSHTTFSTFDGLGYPEDHVEYIWENGCDAYTVTDHGHMNALPYQIEAVKQYRKDGKDIKPVYGVEAYVIPSLDNWQKLYDAKKTGKREEINATIIEDEDTKKDINNKLKERRHMVLLAQNQQGLENLFKLISDSYKEENFYYFPRIDYEMLEEYNEGIISTSSCLHPDMRVKTDIGRIKIRDLVKKIKNGKEIKAKSYNFAEERVEYKKISWGDKTREESRLLKVRLKNGEEIKLTPDHKVYTDSGWVEAGNLSEDMKILGVKK